MHCAIAAGLLTLVLIAVPARAGSVAADNACFYSVNQEFRNQVVTLSGVGSPLGALPGTVATLSGASISAALPPSLPEQGYESGIFHGGVNPIPAKVWIAVAATNAAPATQVLELSVTTSTTIVDGGPDGFVSGTPIVVTIPIPDTSWTVLGTGPVTFSQAAAGTLPNLPVGVDDKLQPIKGSIVVKPDLGSLRFVMDCQPGSTAAPFKAAIPAVPPAFATLESDAPAPPVPPPPPPPVVAQPVHRVASAKLKITGSNVNVLLTCPTGTLKCAGRLALRSVAPIKVGKSRRVLLVAPLKSYDIPAGKRKTLKLRLGSAARTLMRKRASLRVRVTLTPAAAGGKVIKRDLTLKR